MWTIELKDLRFYAFHGLYPIEKKIGQWFCVDCAIQFESPSINSLQDTRNYELIYQVIKACMEVPHELLETLAQRIAEQLKECLQYNKLRISIHKLKPLMGKEVAQSTVSLQF